MTLKIFVNGEPLEIPDNFALKDIIEILEVTGRYAIEVNGEIVPKSQHLDFAINNGDAVEVVKAVGGG